MPFALVIAFVASLGIHAAALFGPDIELSTEPESLPIVAELRPLPKPLPLPQQPIEPEAKPKKPVPAKPRAARRKVETVVSASPVWSVPEDLPESVAQSIPDLLPESIAAPVQEPVAPPPEPEPVPVEPRLPSRGMIHYRVDRGDSNFEIGFAHHTWEIADGRYQLSSVLETTGLVWLFKPYRIEMKSLGLMVAEGLRPETFAIRRNGQETKEKAAFDWETMKVRVGDRAEQALLSGSQDLLSFNYQLGFMPHPESGGQLPIATGKKYGVYRLEVLGDEEIEVPAGVLHTLHLRAPGESTTELWLAYDYLLLPVKIRYVDRDGGSFVQVATQIQLSSE
jgi:hypothetical protein